MPDDAPPRVFVSHGSEDKERFVLPFATRLRENGVDAWVDRWEMLGGDSLVLKIFEEGLDTASAVIVVLSRASIDKPWVREELHSAVVKRINQGSKLIPIVLDDLDVNTEVPAAIRHLLLEYVPDPSNLDDVAERVVRAIFGETSAPPLGRRPRFASDPAVKIGRLDQLDSHVLRLIGAEAVRDSGDLFAISEFVESATAELDATAEQIGESLEVLHERRYIALNRVVYASSTRFELTDAGLRTYLRAYEPAWPRWEQTVHARLATWPDDGGSEADLRTAAGDVPDLVVRSILKRLDRRGLRLSKVHGGRGWHFYSISASLRRLADE